MKWLKKHHIFMKILSLLIAVILWAIVLTTDNPEKTIEFTDIPVTLIGEGVLLSQSNLAVVDDTDYTVSVKLKGNFNRLSLIEESNITVRADVSKLTEAGTYTLTYDISVPNGISIVSRSPEYLSVQLGNIVDKQLDVRVEYEGELSEGIEISEAVVEPTTVTVRGFDFELENAVYAVVKLSAADLEHDFSGSLPYYVADEGGNELEFRRTLERKTESVKVDIPVWKTKSVPLTVSPVGTAGVAPENVSFVCNPSEVVIRGKTADIDAIESLDLGEVYAADFLSSGQVICELTLPETVTFKDEPVTTVQVSLSLINVEIKQITLEEYKLENVPEGMKAEVETQNIILNVRGPASILRRLSAEDFTVTIDLATARLQEGRQVINAAVSSTAEGFDIYGVYSVVVNITK